MRSLLPNVQDKKVLSLGCGSGEDSNYLQQQGASESVGIDISDELIKIAIESYPNCSFKTMDMEKLDFPDRTFDFAYSSLALHYLSDWSQTFTEVFRILKPNSYFLFSCNHPLLSAMDTTERSDEVRIRQLSMATNKKTKTVEIVGDYLERHANVDGVSGLEVTTWHKSMTEILNESASAGFVLDVLLEPKPLQEMEEVSPLNFEKLSKIPFFILFRLSRP
jgi:ubiquinone/menaquinone biosynthesis C-methylase UbiE